MLTFIQRPLRGSGFLSDHTENDGPTRLPHHVHNLLIGQTVETDAVQLGKQALRSRRKRDKGTRYTLQDMCSAHPTHVGGY